MDNYQQKLFLLCALLVGCVLTSIGAEYFTKADELIQIPEAAIVEQHVVQKERETSNIQKSISKDKRVSSFQEKPSKTKSTDEKADNESKNIVIFKLPPL